MIQANIFSKIARTAVCFALPFLAACDLPNTTTSLRPQAAAQRPADTSAAENARMAAASSALRQYYAQVMTDSRTRGLLRTDGGGPDTPYTSEMLARNFEQIAFFSEYTRGQQPLRKWTSPIRIGISFGDDIPLETRVQDTNAVAAFASRLARITGHSIRLDNTRPNFQVMFANETTRASFGQMIQRDEPDVDGMTLRAINEIPRSTYCLVVAFTPPNNSSVYTSAYALIRAEQPDLMRLSCIHEEIAQGLGLANDSPFARPSIFNDDDEFALLTSHDEALLRILYDPRMRPGANAAGSRAVVREIASELLDGNS